MPKAYRRRSWRRPLTVLTVIAVLLAVGGYAAYKAYQHYVVQLLTVPGCQAGTGNNAIPLDFGQAADAATVAAVAARDHLPARALTIAYATAFQESKLENLSYGDRDSVGIFQQRPSQGWGSAAHLQDPAYATQAFFGALVKVPQWATIPVYRAAQAVQRSADGAAYQQYAQAGAQLAADFSTQAHAVTCWYSPSAQAADENISLRLNLTGALKGVSDAFGPTGPGKVVTRITRGTSGKSSGASVVLRPATGEGWTVANWLVTHASSYGITQVSYAGYKWKAVLSETSWQSDPSSGAGGIVAS